MLRCPRCPCWEFTLDSYSWGQMLGRSLRSVIVAVGFCFQGNHIISRLVSEVGSIWLADPSYLTSKIMQMGRIDSDQGELKLLPSLHPSFPKQPVSKPLCKPPDKKSGCWSGSCVRSKQNEGNQNLIEHGFNHMFFHVEIPILPRGQANHVHPQRKFNSSPLKSDGWKPDPFLLGFGNFSGASC